MTAKEKLDALGRAEECAYAALGSGDIEKQMLALDFLAKIDLERSTILCKEDLVESAKLIVAEHPVETLVEAFKENNPPAEEPKQEIDVAAARLELKQILKDARDKIDATEFLGRYGTRRLSELAEDKVLPALEEAKSMVKAVG